MKPRINRLAALAAGMLLMFSMVAVDHADARRGGSFGSRGTRTFQSAPPTRTAPQQTAPVERSMTPNTAPNSQARPGQAAQRRPGFMNGFGGSMLRGLAIGGLFGLLLGHGFGGMAGLFGLLVQVLLIGGAVMLALRFFRSQQSSAPAMAGNAPRPQNFGRDASPDRSQSAMSAFNIPGFGSGSGGHAAETSELEPSQADLDTFEQRLSEVQLAFGREDHAALRKLATPEMVSFFSEELADNAKNGLRNDVSEITLLQADIAESWREGDEDYATAALRYQSHDVMRRRDSGAVVEGDPDEATEATELWTFTRRGGAEWKLSAIQEVGA